MLKKILTANPDADPVDILIHVANMRGSRGETAEAAPRCLYCLAIIYDIPVTDAVIEAEQNRYGMTDEGIYYRDIVISSMQECMEVDNMLRVPYDDIEIDEESDICYCAGKPFTGIAYELYKNGRVSDETEYTDGYPRGAYRVWYPSGILKSEGYTPQKGEVGGWEREWFETGNLKREFAFGEYGFCIREKKWNEQGELIYEYKRPSCDQQS